MLYYTHGGGYVVGDALIYEKDFIKMVNGNNIALVSVEYTLAPEKPYPADLNDAYYGLKYVFDNAKNLT